MHKSNQNKLDKFVEVHASASIRNYHDRQDVIQDCRVLLIILKKKYRDLTPDEFGKLARTAVRNRVRDYIRSRRARPELPHPKPAQISLSQMDSRAILERIKARVGPQTKSILHFMQLGLEREDIKTLFDITSMQLSRELRQARLSITEEVKDALHHRESEIGSRKGIATSDSEDDLERWYGDLGAVQLRDNQADLVHSAR